MTILFISNGHGEDAIACNLIRAFKNNADGIIDALPLVGTGSAYDKMGITPLTQNKRLPSGGFLRHLRHIKEDIKSGLFKNLTNQREALKKSNPDIVVVVGDVFCLTFAATGTKAPCFFVPTAKSNRFMAHSRIEEMIIKKSAKAVFPRDEETASSLKSHGINAHYLGNPMMDHLSPTGDDLGYSPDDTVIGILPGSRQEALHNLSHILTVVEVLDNYKFVAALTADFSMDGLSEYTTDWQLTSDRPMMLTHTPTGKQVQITENFTDVLHISKVIIGLAGTANEQAVFVGKPVICFEGFGPQSTRKRFLEQQKLVGKGL